MLFGSAIVMAWDASEIRKLQTKVEEQQGRLEKEGATEAERLKLLNAARKYELTQQVQIVREQENALRQIREIQDRLKALEKETDR